MLEKGPSFSTGKLLYKLNLNRGLMIAMGNKATKRIFLSIAMMLFVIAATPGKTANAADLRELISKVGMAMLLKPDEAPDFVLKNLNGKDVKLSDFRSKIVLLNFMDTGCHWCRKEMPHLQELYDKFGDSDLAIVVVFQDRKGTKAVAPFIKKTGYTFAISSGLLDPTGEVGNLYSVTGTPTTLLLDRKGMVIAWGMGYRNWSSKASIALIAELLQPPKKPTIDSNK